MEGDQTIEEFIKSELKRMLDEELAKQPWWCIICGAGGNYEGERPPVGKFWIPPKDHICEPKPNPELKGIINGL